jgi:DNA modification methylase
MPRDLKIEHVAVSDLVPYARNARTHSEEQIGVIATSIQRFGWTNPVLIGNDSDIIAGHGRVLAAKRLGIKTVPTLRIGDLSAAERRAYVIADNQTALRAGWDLDVLRLELTELKGMDFDLGPLGFDEAELAAILDVRPIGATDPDAAPEVPANPVAIRGDLWALGRHRLLCGDATLAEDVQALLGGEKPHLMVTDPPYGVDYDANWRNERDRASGKPYGASAVGRVSNDGQADWRAAWSLFPGDIAYCWHAGLRANSTFDSLAAAGFDIRAQIIWVKQQFAIGRGDYHFQHEPCWYAVRKGKPGQWAGDRKQTTVWEIDKPHKSETGHSTQKPIECMKRPIENNSKPGDAVYDPFVGSGTTIIAAEMTGRACYAIEIDAAYCDVAITRWQNFTGEHATLNGKTFEQVKSERL